MHIDQLRSFRTVVDEGGLTRAARKLHLTQPAISYHIRSLEDACGVALLDRVGNGMQPTQLGQIVYNHAVLIVDQYDSMCGTIASFKELSDGRVGIGAGVSIGTYILAPFVSRFHLRHPSIQIGLLIDRSSTIIDQVQAGTVDFGLVFDHSNSDGLFKTSIFRDPIVLIMAPWQPLANRSSEPMNVRLLNNVPMIAASRDSVRRGIIDKWLAEFGVTPRIELEFDSTTAVARVVAEGVGCAFVIRSAVERELESGFLKVVELDSPQLYADYVLIRRPHSEFPPSACELVQALVGDIKENTRTVVLTNEPLDQFLGPHAKQGRSL